MVIALIGSQSRAPPGLAFNSPGARSETAGRGIMWAWTLNGSKTTRHREEAGKEKRRRKENTLMCAAIL